MRRLSFSTLSCPNWSFEQIIDAAVRFGVQGIDFRGIGSEIDITRLPIFANGALDATMRAVRQHHLELPCFNTSVTLVSPAPQRWQEMLDECRRYAQLAQRTGTRLIRIFGGGVPKEMSRDEGRLMAERHLRQVIKICRSFECTPLVETHDDWSTSGQVLELLHEQDPRDVGVLWDIEHSWRRGESPIDTVTALRRFLRHVHIKDSRTVDGTRVPTLLAEGDLPLRECIHALRETGYDGWICLEAEKRWHTQETPEPEVTIPQFVRFMRQS
jgi:sugar phosphate isomerase/epimerase